jgi:hypothetical protein
LNIADRNPRSSRTGDTGTNVHARQPTSRDMVRGTRMSARTMPIGNHVPNNRIDNGASATETATDAPRAREILWGRRNDNRFESGSQKADSACKEA